MENLVSHNFDVFAHVLGFLRRSELWAVKDVCSSWRRVALQSDTWDTLPFPLDAEDVEDWEAMEGIEKFETKNNLSLRALLTILNALLDAGADGPRRLLLRDGCVIQEEDIIDDLFTTLLKFRRPISAFCLSGSGCNDARFQKRLLVSVTNTFSHSLTELRIEGITRITVRAEEFVNIVSKLTHLQLLSLPYTGLLNETHVKDILLAAPQIRSLRFCPCGCGERPLRVMDPLATIAFIDSAKRLKSDKIHSISVTYRRFPLPYGSGDGVVKVLSSMWNLRSLFLDRCPGPDEEEPHRIDAYADLWSSFFANSVHLESVFVSFRKHRTPFKGIVVSSHSIKHLSFNAFQGIDEFALECPSLESLTLRSLEGNVVIVPVVEMPNLKQFSARWMHLQLNDVADILGQSAFQHVREVSFRVNHASRRSRSSFSSGSGVVVKIEHNEVQKIHISSILPMKTIDCSSLTIRCPKLENWDEIRRTLRISGTMTFSME